MRPIADFENVKASGEFEQLPPGGYVCAILRAEDVPDKEYLKIDFDIASGEFRSYFSSMQERLGWNNGHFFRSYKEKAKGMFKAFTNAVEASNSSYKWDWNEKGLAGLLVGLVLAEEEYKKNNGDIGTRLYVSAVKSVNDIEHDNFKVPAKRLIKEEPSPAGFEPLDNELPF